MRETKLKDLKQYVRKLIKETFPNELKETKKYKCEKDNGETFICIKDERGRSIEWIKVID